VKPSGNRLSEKRIGEGDFMSNDKHTSASDSQIDWQHAEECSRAICDLRELERSIDWKQGLAIALGVPLLILPSIGYFTGYVWAFSIVVWGLTIFLGFVDYPILRQNRTNLKIETFCKNNRLRF
jgi:hypothetical protein